MEKKEYKTPEVEVTEFEKPEDKEEPKEETIETYDSIISTVQNTELFKKAVEVNPEDDAFNQ